MKHISLILCFVVGVLGGKLAPPNLLAQPATSGAPTVTNKFYSSSGEWVRVSNTNCVVWSSWPQEGESVTWTGGITEGKAHGTGKLQWFKNGIATTRYEGELKGGLADGQGVAIVPEAEYVGEWKLGSLVSTNGTIRYADGNWYRGEIKYGFKTGHGEEMMVGGVRYVGQFERDRFSGKGEMFYPNGDRITGEWRDSKLDGVGMYHTKDGDSFKVKQTEAGLERL